MAIKGYPVFHEASALLKPHHHIVLCHIQDTRWGGFTPGQRCSRYILQPQLTGSLVEGGSFTSMQRWSRCFLQLQQTRLLFGGESYPYTEMQFAYSTAHSRQLGTIRSWVDINIFQNFVRMNAKRVKVLCLKYLFFMFVSPSTINIISYHHDHRFVINCSQ